MPGPTTGLIKFQSKPIIRHSMKYTLLLAISLALALPLHAGNKKANGQTQAKPTPQQIFKKKDKDHDGFLTQNEFISKRCKDPAKAAQRFAKKDTNGDGKLSLKEFLAKGNAANVKGAKAKGAKAKGGKAKGGKANKSNQ